jgi:hypothetical protein
MFVPSFVRSFVRCVPDNANLVNLFDFLFVEKKKYMC